MQHAIPLASDFLCREMLAFAQALNIPIVLHRKIWEFAFITHHLPRPNAQMAAHAEVGGHTIYEVIYTTGSDHFRVVPEATEKPDACVLLFGGSFTFGDGVRDDETFAAQIVKRSGGRIAPRILACQDGDHISFWRDCNRAAFKGIQILPENTSRPFLEPPGCGEKPSIRGT